MAERPDTGLEWVGRLVRVLLVFRALVLLITIAFLPAAQRSSAVGLIVIVAALMTYVPLRRWSQIGPSLSRHPAYLGGEVVVTTLILAVAGARSPFFFFTLGTAVLAGVVYEWRGMVPFSALLVTAYELVALEGWPTGDALHGAQSLVLLPMLYPLAVVAGIAAREFVERGVAAELLLAARTEEVVAERERLRVARELHDSLAKTVEGLSLSASALAKRCERNPAGAAELARQLSQDAKQGALEARALMAGLRPGADRVEISLVSALCQLGRSAAERSGPAVEVRCTPEAARAAEQEIAPEARHELVRIAGEAIRNAERHGGAPNVAVALTRCASEWELSVSDDGCGLRSPVELELLQAGGHFGVAGMHERAVALGGSLALGQRDGGGTVVSARVPAVASPQTRSGRSPRSLLRSWRRRSTSSSAARLGGQPP